ncbi:major facilitator superfamily transporter [Pseudomonas putida S11]|nr:major facilitator superfamily transporter [Pseudomonas putida S11]
MVRLSTFYGSLAAIIAKHFFAGVNETTSFIFALLAFAAGFAVRPFGAIVFGRLGDMIGRKYTFLITIVIMGLSTAVVGLLPSYATIGVAAPIILISLRLLQGLALGGEYGGAATYVAEHCTQGPARLFHRLDPDHGHPGAVPLAAGDHGLPHGHG